MFKHKLNSMKLKTEIIRDARLKKRYSQETMSEFLGISQSQYSKLENADVDFEIQQLSTLLDILEINPLEALDFTEKQQMFINSPQSGNLNNSNSFNNDVKLIRKVVRDELGLDSL